MLYKIALSADRKSARVYFDTHSVGFYHSDGLVVELINQIIFEPSARLERYHAELEIRRIASLEDTQVTEVDMQLSFKGVA